jgi:hypothetical protein
MVRLGLGASLAQVQQRAVLEVPGRALLDLPLAPYLIVRCDLFICSDEGSKKKVQKFLAATCLGSCN